VDAGALADFEGYSVERVEVPLGDSRIDLLLSGNEGLCYVETKSVNLVVDGRALFPDAPTERGRRHLGELADAVASGHRARAVFIVQRGDAVEMAPHREADELFGEALDRAVALGVEALAYRCRVTPREITITGSIPVRLGFSDD
jgi:sugar fermentation stimulation protein A